MNADKRINRPTPRNAQIRHIQARIYGSNRMALELARLHFGEVWNG